MWSNRLRQNLQETQRLPVPTEGEVPLQQDGEENPAPRASFPGGARVRRVPARLPSPALPPVPARGQRRTGQRTGRGFPGPGWNRAAARALPGWNVPREPGPGPSRLERS